MAKLSPSGTQFVQDLSLRYGISADAATHMLIAVSNGNGTMAQFGHPEFGGSGQWMQGGMTMVSDLFNHQLKALVDNLCCEISQMLANHQQGHFVGSFQSQSQSGSGNQAQSSGGIANGIPGVSNDLFERDPESSWWPAELGAPNSVGSQNNTRYAYFSDQRRLAVSTGGTAWIYDTLDHQIGGFGQQQGGDGGSLTFTSQYGTVSLASLPVISRDGTLDQPTESPSTPIEQAERPAAEPKSGQPVAASDSESDIHVPELEVAPGPAPTCVEEQKPEEDILQTIEKLGDLKEKGYITEEEFSEKKQELLSRL